LLTNIKHLFEKSPKYNKGGRKKCKGDESWVAWRGGGVLGGGDIHFRISDRRTAICEVQVLRNPFEKIGRGLGGKKRAR